MQLRGLMIKIRRSSYVKKTLGMFFKLASLLPTRKNTIVFESFLGKQYSDNPKALYLYIKEHFPEYKLYWSFDRNVVTKMEGEGLNILPRFGFRWNLVMGRAEYWITNSRLPLWIPKPTGTTYVQTWHGTPLKRLAVDMDEVHMPGTTTDNYKKNFVDETQKWDYLISPNAYSTKIFKRAFQFNKTVIESGYPRNDILTNGNDANTIYRLKNSMNLPQSKKVILYAPTWRDNQYYAVGRYKFNLEMDLPKMQEALGDDYVIALRLHYLVAENIDLRGFEDFIYDFSNYDDINELYLISDLLITDYSSVFFDYAKLKRPVLFFVYDLEEYRDTLRGFYFDLEKEAPGPLLKTTDDIIEYIRALDERLINYQKRIEGFCRTYCYLEDGKASERATSVILSK